MSRKYTVHLTILDAWSMRKQWWNLEDLLTATCNRKTTQPHDKVFSLLGLTLNGVLDEVPIDYDQPHTVTFQKAMVHVLRSNMSFLVHAMHFQRNDSVPSWCVDFLTLDWPSHARACMFHSSSKELSTTPGRKIRSSVLHNPVNGTIEVIATILGRLDYVNISKCAPPNLQDSEKDRYRQDYTAEHPTINQREFRYRQYECLVHDVQDFRKAAQRALGSQFSQHEVAWMLSTDIVWRTMGNAEPKLDAAEFSLLEAASLDDDYLQLEARAQTNFEQIGKLANRTLEAVTAVSLNLIDKNLFTTDTGFLGQASTAVNAILEGDWLCIIHGCHVPMILRQAPGMTAYKVVTFSWVSTLTEELLYGGVGQRSQKLTLC